MGNFLKPFPGGFGGDAIWQQYQKVKPIVDRLTPIAKEHRKQGERFKIIARPHQRRAVLDTSISLNMLVRLEVTLRAIDEKGNDIEISRIWTTKNGKNKDFRRSAKGKGTPGDLGPYQMIYKPAVTGISKFKAQTVGDAPSIVFYSVRQLP